MEVTRVIGVSGHPAGKGVNFQHSQTAKVLIVFHAKLLEDVAVVVGVVDSTALDLDMRRTLPASGCLASFSQLAIACNSVHYVLHYAAWPDM